MGISRGFSLIEVMVTLIIISVGMLAMGSFYFAMSNSENEAQKRLAAVHMAEQIIEDWQKTNVLPIPNCKQGGAAATVLEVNVEKTNCVPNDGVPVSLTILLTETPALAPIPRGHALHSGGASDVEMGGMLRDLAGDLAAATNRVLLRRVRVSWSFQQMKGKASDANIAARTQSVVLTHITSKQ